MAIRRLSLLLLCAAVLCTVVALALPAPAAASGVAGVYACQWDSTVNGADQQTFVSFLKSGEVVADGLNLPPEIIDSQEGVKLDPGHGIWKLRNGKVQLRVHFGPSNGGSRHWLLTGSLTRGANHQLTGDLTLSRFANLGAATPEATHTLGFVGGSTDGTGI